MKNSAIATFLCLIFITLAGTQCTVNHHQEDFVNQALGPPSGIQSMTSNGKHKSSSESDPEDWRTAPQFSGLFKVETPAFPNPVAYNSQIKILIKVSGFNAINGLYGYAFRQPGDITPSSSIAAIQRTLTPGLHTITIKPRQFASAGGTGNFGNIYRIIFMDGRQQIITYGDVRVK